MGCGKARSTDGMDCRSYEGSPLVGGPSYCAGSPAGCRRESICLVNSWRVMQELRSQVIYSKLNNFEKFEGGSECFCIKET